MVFYVLFFWNISKWSFLTTVKVFFSGFGWETIYKNEINDFRLLKRCVFFNTSKKYFQVVKCFFFFLFFFFISHSFLFSPLFFFIFVECKFENFLLFLFCFVFVFYSILKKWNQMKRKKEKKEGNLFEKENMLEMEVKWSNGSLGSVLWGVNAIFDGCVNYSRHRWSSIRL